MQNLFTEKITEGTHSKVLIPNASSNVFCDHNFCIIWRDAHLDNKYLLHFKKWYDWRKLDGHLGWLFLQMLNRHLWWHWANQLLILWYMRQYIMQMWQWNSTQSHTMIETQCQNIDSGGGASNENPSIDIVTKKNHNSTRKLLLLK